MPETNKPGQGSGSAWFRPKAIYLGFLIGGTIAGLAVIGAVSAATFVPPAGNPPLGNIPVTVWNRVDATGKQLQAAIDIDGGGPPPAATGLSVGTATLDMGVDAPGQNVLYGISDYDKMCVGCDGNADHQDLLMLLQTANATGVTDRLRITRDGDVAASGKISSSGDVRADGCFGPIFQGITGNSYAGDLGGGANGYFAANAQCAQTFTQMPGVHVCSTAEMLNSLKCAKAYPPHKIKDAGLNGVDIWIQDGPPGYTASANDCQGWQSASGGDLGRIWRMSSSNGGQGFLTTCNQQIKFACCW